MSQSRRALVASDSHVAKDPRVMNQIRWLMSDGWTVDSVGRGPRPDGLNGEHFPMPLRPFLVRVLANLFLPTALRYRVLVGSTVPQSLNERSTPYDLAVLNEIELLPWFVDSKPDALESPRARRVHLDLHEYSPSQRRGMLHSLVFERYRRWMTGFIPAPVFSSRSVVSPGIAQLYVDLFSIPKPSIVRSCPPFAALEPQPTNPSNIHLVYHGAATATRGLENLLAAMETIEERFTLHLMLVGDPKIIAGLKRSAQALGARVAFPPPVAMPRVAAALNEFDLEVVFFPPVTENLRYALPNKVFEAIQGRLGLVIGESPDMVDLVKLNGNGAIVSGWSPADLAARINALTVDEIDELKRGSHRAAEVYSSETERQNFLQAIA